MITFVGIVPHSPLLLDVIGKEHTEKLSQTLEAFKVLRQKLDEVQPDAIVVVSPHSKNLLEDAFTVNITHPEHLNTYQADFKDFGEYSTHFTFSNDLELLQTLLSIHPEIPVVPTHDENLDHGVSVPLSLLGCQPNMPIIPIGYSALENEIHNDFGKKLYEIFGQSHKRIAVLFSAELAHTLSEDAPGGFHSSGAVFDQKIRNTLSQRNIEALHEFNEQMVQEAVSCGYKALLILAGLLNEYNYSYNELSYEFPFGIGYLTAYFDLKKK